MPTPTNVYIDGFNLYYGCLKNSSFKWLDVAKLAARLLDPRKYVVQHIHFFTARVKPLPQNPGARTRQDFYLRALRTLPNLSVTFGHFLTKEVMRPLAKPPKQGPGFVRVVNTEEKGSDVNLASQLLLDAFNKSCGAMLVISNDSDLLMPIRIARREFGQVVGVVSPHPRPSAALQREADYMRTIRGTAVLQASQFPENLIDAHGAFSKPSAW